MKPNLLLRRIFSFGLALIALFCCYRLIISSASVGYSRLLSTVAIIQPNIEPADRAVSLTPDDPEAHYTRALSLVNQQKLPEAVAELQHAIRLRPHHYYQWLDLGVTLQRVGSQAEAIAALRESIRLAPSFSQPHWQLGNLLYRQELYDEAFQEFRLGAKNSPNLFLAMLDLAWVAAAQDVPRFESLIQPDSGRSHFELARFLAQQGKGADAARHARTAGFPRDEDELNLVRQAIANLLVWRSSAEAFDIWLVIHPDSKAGKGQLLNGDFSEAILANDPGFGWQLPKSPNVTASIDPSGPTPNSRSLRIEFAGEIPAEGQVLYQMLVLVPNSNYSLSFLAKTEDLLSGGPPVISILDASSESPVMLGQSKPLSPGTPDWTSNVVEFSTPEKSSTVIVALKRMPCSESRCPVFGKLWLGRFVLTKS